MWRPRVRKGVVYDADNGAPYWKGGGASRGCKRWGLLCQKPKTSILHLSFQFPTSSDLAVEVWLECKMIQRIKNVSFEAGGTNLYSIPKLNDGPTTWKKAGWNELTLQLIVMFL